MNVVKVTSKTESDRLKIHPQRYKEVIFMTTSFQKLRTFTLPMGFRGRNAVVVVFAVSVVGIAMVVVAVATAVASVVAVVTGLVIA